LKSSLYIFFLAITVFASAATAQSDSARPQPILVDVIGASGKRVARSVRTVNASFAVNRYGSANEVEARAFDLMNGQRQAIGLGSLEWDEQIVSLARAHSQNMATGKYFSHKDTNGGYVDDRAAKLGIFNWLAIGENIAFMRGYDDPATMAVEKWMQSPSHKKNILNNQWRQTAIGVAVGDGGSVYFTQIFIY
jgi:uncharacterized protein YkwD